MSALFHNGILLHFIMFPHVRWKLLVLVAGCGSGCIRGAGCHCRSVVQCSPGRIDLLPRYL